MSLDHLSTSGIGVTNGTNNTETATFLYLEHDFPLMIVTAVVIGAAAIIGTLGNILIILTVCLVRTLRTCGNVFVLNLALADLVVTAFIDPFNVIGAVAARKFLIPDHILCDWVASFCAPACMSSMWNMCAISLNRYILICKPHLYNKVFTFRSTIACCVAIWIMAHMLHLPNHLGWGVNKFNVEYYLCTFDILTHSYAIFYVVTGILIPLVGVLYGYTCIFIKVREVKSQLRNHHLAVLAAGNENKANRNAVSDKNKDLVDVVYTGPVQAADLLPLSSKEKLVKEDEKPHITIVAEQAAARLQRPKRPGFTQDDVKLAKTLFAAFLVFLICWLPFALFVLANEPSEIPNWLYVVAIIMAHGNSAVNPILYGLTNEKFRNGYRRVLGLEKTTIVPAPGTRMQRNSTSRQRTSSHNFEPVRSRTFTNTTNWVNH